MILTKIVTNTPTVSIDNIDKLLFQVTLGSLTVFLSDPFARICLWEVGFPSIP